MGGSTYDEKGMGALPPPGAGWQIGKTAASIRFVAEAEGYLAGECAESDAALLNDAIARIKRGELVLDAIISPQDFLRAPR